MFLNVMRQVMKNDYYEDYDTLNDETRQMTQQSMVAFGGIAPTYHIALLDKPTIVWDFHSLLLDIQMMFSFMLTDSENQIKLCRHCAKAFVASRPSAVFCSPQHKNGHNVYKSRAKDKKEGWKTRCSIYDRQIDCRSNRV